MPEETAIAASNEASASNENQTTSIPRIHLSRQSFSGTITLGGEILENCKRDLQFPKSIHTFDCMAEDQDIQPALEMVETSLVRVPWSVVIPEGYEEELKEDAEFLRQCLFEDMEHSFNDFIAQAVTFNRYGFSAIEKVFRTRRSSSGSKFNDGKIGLAALPLIDHKTILGWKWDEKYGRKLTHVVQYKNKPTGFGQGNSLIASSDGNNYVEIRREKFLLFRNKVKGDSPSSLSPLVSVHKAWKIKCALEEYLAIGVAKDLQGIPKLTLPAEVMATDADESKKEEFAYWQNVLRNIHNNSQAGLMFPALYDEVTKQPLYNLETVESGGKKAYDVLAIIEFYRKSIVTALMASQLLLGQDGGGSYALSESLSGVSSIVIEAKLKEIEAQLNHDLIPQLFALNGINKRVLPKVKFGDLSNPDLDILSKFVQRCAAVGVLPRTPAFVNWLTQQINAPIPFDDVNIPMEEAEKLLTGYTSGAGEGMEQGMPSGTGKADGSSGDSSASNTENV